MTSDYEKLQANIRAIEIALRDKNLSINQREREALLAYSGFGGLKCVLLDPNRPEEFSKSEQSLVPLVKELHEVIRQGAGGDAKTYMDSLQASILTSFYTPIELVDTLQSVMFDNRIHIENSLDPSAGLGVFSRIKADRYMMIEKDLLTGLILSRLHPDKEVLVGGFEAVPLNYNNSFNLVASNIPFGDFRVFDPSYLNSRNKYLRDSTKTIHTYFFEKGLDMLQEGGLLVFITSTGIMDARSHANLREHLISRSHLISAVRLPEGTFSDTKVQSDLIILQKNSRRSLHFSEQEQLFMRTDKMEVEGQTFFMNGLYAEQRYRCLGTTSVVSTNLYGHPEYRFTHQGGILGISTDLRNAVERSFIEQFDRRLFLKHNRSVLSNVSRPIQLDLFDTVREIVSSEKKPPIRFDFQNEVYSEKGSFQVANGEIGIAVTNTIAEVVGFENPMIKQAVIDYCYLRDCYYQLSRYEQQYQMANEQFRHQLNEAYERFRQTPLATSFEDFSIKRLSAYVGGDPSYLEILGIEYWSDNQLKKADIFFQPVAFSISKREFSAQDALAASRNQFNKVDLHYMSQLSGLSTDQLVNDLQGVIFKNEALEFETKDTFLSGDVLDKQENILRLISQYPDDYFLRSSLKALEEVIPDRIPFHDIGLNLGERWIPDRYYQAFAEHLFKEKSYVQYNAMADDFIVDARWSLIAHERFSVKTYSRSYQYSDVLRYALIDQIPDLKMKVQLSDGRIEEKPDTQGIERMNMAMSSIRHEWYQWISSLDLEHKLDLEALYNRKFNNVVLPQFDGSFQTFPDLDLKQCGYKDLYATQKNAILQIKSQGGGIIDHKVGGGKTMIMCVSAYEMKRLGLVNKPLILGIKANVLEIASTFQRAYPKANLLYAGKEDFSPQKRAEFFSKIQNNNWDCIIMTHEQFQAIPISERIQKEIYLEEREKLKASINSIDSQLGKRIKSGLQRRLQNVEAKIASITHNLNTRKDLNTIDFETMGIDHIFCDESHKFKNLMTQTRHTRVAGIGNTTGSNRSLNMKFAIRSIQKKTGRDLGATFLSGTTVVNSLTELYSLFDYLRPSALQKQNIFCFDAWASIFTRKTKELEFGVTGELQLKERFREFVKVPELAKFYAEITDYKTEKHIGLDIPTKNEMLVMLEQTDAQRDMFSRLKEFAKTGNGSVIFRENLSQDEYIAKMLIATNTAKKASIDMRLIDETRYGAEDSNRTKIVAEKAYDYYKRFHQQKGTQFIFSDLGTYKNNAYNVYSDLKNRLELLGVPENEILFLGANISDKKRAEIVQKMNAGEIRILIGSTERLGTGINAQQRCVAIHHVDIPWTPKDFEQRNGRGVRTNNQVAKLYNNNQVDVLIYATQETLDVYKFNLIANKEAFISQIKNSTINVRSIDEGGMDVHTGMSYKDYIAVLSGNTDLMEKAKLERELTLLRSEEKSFVERGFKRDKHVKELVDELSRNRHLLDCFHKDKVCFDEMTRDGKGNVVTEMIVRGDKFLSLKEFGVAINSVLDEQFSREQFTKIGCFGGFGLLVRPEEIQTRNGLICVNKLCVSGNLKYYHNNGNVARSAELAGQFPQHALQRIDGLIDRFEKRCKIIEADIQSLSLLTFDFPHKEKMIQIECRLKNIDDRLSQMTEKTSHFKSIKM